MDTKPYLLQALYEWCVDNGQTPHIVAWINRHTRMPMRYVYGNKTALNIGPTASRNLNIDNEWVNFSACFNSMTHDIWIPAGHIISISARESGKGMNFEVEPCRPENTPTQEQIPQSESKDAGSTKPKKGLKLVK